MWLTPPWLLQVAKFEFSLCDYGSRGLSSPDTFQSPCNKIVPVFDGFRRLFADGSKDDASIAAAAVSGSAVMVKWLPDRSSIFLAEAEAISRILDAVEKSTYCDQFLVLFESVMLAGKLLTQFY